MNIYRIAIFFHIFFFLLNRSGMLFPMNIQLRKNVTIQLLFGIIFGAKQIKLMTTGLFN